MPASPAAAGAQHCKRPMPTRSAPDAIALTISLVRQNELSSMIFARPRTASTISGSTDGGEHAQAHNSDPAFRNAPGHHIPGTAECSTISGPTDLVSAMYAEGTSMAIVGASDFTPHTSPARLLFLFNSLIGMSAMSLTLTYLMQVYTALQRRNVLAMNIHSSWGAQAMPPNCWHVSDLRGSSAVATSTALKLTYRTRSACTATSLYRPARGRNRRLNRPES